MITVTIDYTRPDGSKGAMCSGPEHVAQSVKYYLDMGYEVSTEINEFCDGCQGHGKVRTKRLHKHEFCFDRCWRTCPTCKGTGK